jgi:hypothetical protein
LATIKRRNEHSPRARLTAYKIFELLTGRCDYPVTGYTGYGSPGGSTNLADFIDDDMRLDWEASRETLLEFWASGEDSVTWFHPQSKPWLFTWGTPSTLPWAARMFDEEKS